MSDFVFPDTPLVLSEEALFRHHVVSDVLARILGGELRANAVEKVAAGEHYTMGGERRAVALRTLYRWLAAFHRGGIAALEPASRSKIATSVVLPARFVDFLRSEKQDDPYASVPEIIRRAREEGILTPEAAIDRVSVYRAAVRMGLPLTVRGSKRNADVRRFAYPHRMQMLLSDGKHFRAGARRTKRVALFVLDDCTRRGLTACVGPSESTKLFLRGLFEVIRHHGLMDVVYLDRGPGFISHDTHAVFVRLGVHLVHGAARYPEGHGKIEKFNQTAYNDVLRGLVSADVDDDCGALELRLRHYLDHQYNVRPHESLEDRMTPLQRWDADERPLRFPASETELRERFVLTETRRVSHDNIVSVGSIAYEVPRGHAGTSLPVRRNMLDASIRILHDAKLVQLHPVDLAANAQAHRSGAKPSAGPTSHSADVPPLGKAPRTAAERAYQRDFRPLVGKDGGLLRPPTK